MYEAAAKFKAKHGVAAVPPEDMMIDGNKLRSWLFREQGILDGLFDTKRSQEQIDKLARIGIVKKSHDYRERTWNEKYNAVNTFVSQNKRLPKTTENRPLFKWVSDQCIKYASGKLAEDKADKLRSIGVRL